jgi:hypothetical protein
VQAIWDKGLSRECTDLSVIAYIGAAFNITDDLVILMLPMPCVYALNIGLGKRFSLIIMFCIGSLYVVPYDVSHILLYNALTQPQCVYHEHDSPQIFVRIWRL